MTFVAHCTVQCSKNLAGLQSSFALHQTHSMKQLSNQKLNGCNLTISFLKVNQVICLIKAVITLS